MKQMFFFEYIGLYQGSACYGLNVTRKAKIYGLSFSFFCCKNIILSFYFNSYYYSYVKDEKNTLKIFGFSTWCTKNLSVTESHTTNIFLHLVQDKVTDYQYFFIAYFVLIFDLNNTFTTTDTTVFNKNGPQNIFFFILWPASKFFLETLSALNKKLPILVNIMHLFSKFQYFYQTNNNI